MRVNIARLLPIIYPFTMWALLANLSKHCHAYRLCAVVQKKVLGIAKNSPKWFKIGVLRRKFDHLWQYSPLNALSKEITMPLLMPNIIVDKNYV